MYLLNHLINKLEGIFRDMARGCEF